LFTLGAMVIAQAVLALPIVIALVADAVADLWAEYGPAFQIDGATRLQAIPHLLAMARNRLVTAILAGFGRTISEVGPILIVAEGEYRRAHGDADPDQDRRPLPRGQPLRHRAGKIARHAARSSVGDLKGAGTSDNYHCGERVARPAACCRRPWALPAPLSVEPARDASAGISPGIRGRQWRAAVPSFGRRAEIARLFDLKLKSS
jgi:hypothetical protein